MRSSSTRPTTTLYRPTCYSRAWSTPCDSVRQAGAKNRDAIANALQYTGKAILNDLNFTAQNQQMSQCSAKFQGSKDLTPYTPPTE